MQSTVGPERGALATATVPATPTGLAAPSISTVLRRRPFFWFTIGQSTSFFGDKLHGMALIGLIGAAVPDSSAIVLAELALLYCLPFLVITPLAGILVDRWNRKWTLIGCDALRAVLVAATPVAYALTASLTILLGLVAGVFLLTMLFDVAKMAIIPDLVSEEELLEANTVSGLLARVATLAGIVLGGAIVGWRYWAHLGVTGYTAAFYLDALTFVVSVVTLLALPNRSKSRPVLTPSDGTPHAGSAGKRPRFWLEVREVATLARRETSVLFVLITSALLGLVGGCMYVVVVVVVQTRTAWSTPGVGYVFGIMACGIVAGSIVMSQRGQQIRRHRVITLGFLAIAVLLGASARPFDFAWHGPLSFAGGLVIGPMMIVQDTLLHEVVPDALRGRVFSARDVLLNVGFGLAAAATGLTVTVLSGRGVADPFRPTLLVAAPLVFLVTVAAARLEPRRLA